MLKIVKNEAVKYTLKTKEEDKIYGYTPDDIGYGDIRRAFKTGAEWAISYIRKRLEEVIESEWFVDEKNVKDIFENED